eukprot:4466519-Heterocapsa_arctica.AAC.1
MHVDAWRDRRERGVPTLIAERDLPDFFASKERRREQNAKRSHRLGNNQCKGHGYKFDHIRSIAGSNFPNSEGSYYFKQENGGGLEGSFTTCRLEKTEGRGQLHLVQPGCYTNDRHGDEDQ